MDSVELGPASIRRTGKLSDGLGPWAKSAATPISYRGDSALLLSHAHRDAVRIIEFIVGKIAGRRAAVWIVPIEYLTVGRVQWCDQRPLVRRRRRVVNNELFYVIGVHQRRRTDERPPIGAVAAEPW